MPQNSRIDPETIIECLNREYEIRCVGLDILPLGADADTFTYRATTSDSDVFFVKLRSGKFNPMTVIVPRFLHEQGIEQIIPPLLNKSNQPWTTVGDYTLMLFAFVDGKNGYETSLSDQHWIELGRTLKRMHTSSIPAAISQAIPREDYSSRWRENIRKFLDLIAQSSFDDPIARELVECLQDYRNRITTLVNRAESLAEHCSTIEPEFVLCHADLHAGNVLIDEQSNLLVVDWDTLTIAPKERDLMYAGGGQFNNFRTPQDEERLFYEGYGQTTVHLLGLAYYRYERIVQDISAFCEEILLSEGDEQGRKLGLKWMKRQFEPDNVLDVADASYRRLADRYKTRLS